MKSYKFLLIYLFIALQVFTGCNSSAEPTSADVPPYNDAQDSHDNSNLIDEKYKDKAVIIDTVVDIFRDPDINSERVTQALFNQPVTVMEEKETWIKVKVADGYTGWLRSKFIDTDCTSIKKELYSDRIVITGKKKTVYTNYGGGATLKEAVMGTEFYVKSKRENFYEVVLPGKLTGWIEIKNTIQLPADALIPKTTAEDFVATVERFKGVPYLWGGVSAWEGVDCSGLVYICSRINGVDLPRDADQQFNFIKEGAESIEAIKKGDLVFFSTHEDLKDVSHMGVYIGDGQFINASEAKGSVIISSLHSDYYNKRLKGIKRIL